MKDLLLMKWGAKWCPPCQALAKNRTLEKFAETHLDVKVEVHDAPLNGDPSAAWSKGADDYGVKNLPTLVWADRDGNLLLKSENASLAAIREQYVKARRKLDRG